MLTVAVVPHKQADYQMLSGCILPERKPQAVKLLLDHLGGAQGACKVSDRQRNASLSGIASKLEGGALDEITRKECARGRNSAASQLLGTQNRH